MLSFFTSFLSSYLTPAVLFTASAVAFFFSEYRKTLSPKRFFSALLARSPSSSVSPFRALSLALAGTLGVGNITGVTSAILSGGPGTVVWMALAAVVALPVKYAEVFLAVRFRKKGKNGYTGGAMYYLSDGLSPLLGRKNAAALGSVFALFCLANALITGTLVQSNAAVSIVAPEWRLPLAFLMALSVLLAMCCGVEKINRITAAVLPPLCLGYIVLSLGLLFANASLLGEVARDIFSSAFSFRAVKGAAFGFGVREAMRYGVMRGLFSNEAGCGTSPTAHASADTPSPHHQACYGVAEVLFDTVVLCPLTAFVVLIADKKIGVLPMGTNADSSPVTLSAFFSLGGDAVYRVLIGCIVLFAFSTVLAQFYYGSMALRFVTGRKSSDVMYRVLTLAVLVAGSVVSSPVMWTLADCIIGLMTVLNGCAVTVILLTLREKRSRPLSAPR